VQSISLPKEIYGNGDEYDTLMESLLPLPDVGYVGIFNKISLRTIFALERIIGWGLLILMINTISRVMIYY